MFKRQQLVIKYVLRLMEHASYQCALAVIDAATSNETQGILILLLLEESGYLSTLQKYPSSFFFSIDPG